MLAALMVTLPFLAAPTSAVRTSRLRQLTMPKYPAVMLAYLALPVSSMLLLETSMPTSSTSSSFTSMLLWLLDPKRAFLHWRASISILDIDEQVRSATPGVPYTTMAPRV